MHYTIDTDDLGHDPITIDITPDPAGVKAWLLHVAADDLASAVRMIALMPADDPCVPSYAELAETLN